MNIGFLGAGTVAVTIAGHVLSRGHTVVLSNSRGPGSLAGLVDELGAGAVAGTPQEAADQDIVVLAVPWPDVSRALSAIPDWAGRVLVDTTNRFSGGTPPSVGDVSGRTSREIVADLAPGAEVVKAFNSVPMAWIADPSGADAGTVLFVSGDHVEAKSRVVALVEEVGLVAIDLGSLAVGGRLQQLGGPLAGARLHLLERFTP